MMRETIRRLYEAAMNNEERDDLARRRLLVIEFPYFEKNLDATGQTKRLSFLTARRSTPNHPWEVSTQFYTRRTLSLNSISDTDFEHGPIINTRDEVGLAELHRNFRLACLERDMTEKQQDTCTYTYGALFRDAKRILGM